MNALELLTNIFFLNLTIFFENSNKLDQLARSYSRDYSDSNTKRKHIFCCNLGQYELIKYSHVLGITSLVK